MEFEVGRRFKLERGFMRFVSFAHLLDFVVNSFQPWDKSGFDSEDPKSSSDKHLQWLYAVPFVDIKQLVQFKETKQSTIFSVKRNMPQRSFPFGSPRTFGSASRPCNFPSQWGVVEPWWWMYVLKFWEFGIDGISSILMSKYCSNILQIVNFRFRWDATLIIQLQLFYSSSAFVWPVAGKMEADPLTSIVMSLWEGKVDPNHSLKRGSLVGKLP